MKTAHLLAALLLLSSTAACSSADPVEEPTEVEESSITAREKTLAIREALFSMDETNEIWLVCRAGSRRNAVTFTIAHVASTLRISADYDKASYFTGYVRSHVPLGDATLGGGFPHRIFTFAIADQPARIELDATGASSSFLEYAGKRTKLSCAEYDAPYELDSLVE